jgi:hypothetical protein
MGTYSKKRRAKTIPKRMDKKAQLSGFIGERYIVKGGEVLPVSVASIGHFVFKISTNHRGLRRAELIDREKLFSTRDAALKALKPVNGWAMDGWRKSLKAVRIVVDSDGNRVAYERKARGAQVRGELFLTKLDALNALKRNLAQKLKEQNKEQARAAADYERVLKQIDQL